MFIENKSKDVIVTVNSTDYNLKNGITQVPDDKAYSILAAAKKWKCKVVLLKEQKIDLKEFDKKLDKIIEDGTKKVVDKKINKHLTATKKIIIKNKK